MADTKISALTSGAPAQATDATVIARSGANYKLTVSDIVGYLGSPITEANGGTGESTYSNGQLLIGNASGGLTKATLTAGTNVTITNGNGAITIAASGGGGGTGDVVGPASAADNAIARYDGTTGKLIQDSGVYVSDANKVSIGSAAPVALTATITPQVQSLGTNISTSAYMVARYSADASQTFYYTAKSRNATVGSHTVLQDNDGLGGIVMCGSDGTNFVVGAEIFGEVDGTPGSGSMPSAIVFRVNSVEKFRVWNDGKLTDDKGNLRAVPQSGSAKTGSYSLATTDVGLFIEVGSGGSITIPDATFAAGDVVSIFNNTASGVTITCSITTAYIAGTDADKASVTLATRGVATVLFISGTVCVISGNVS